MCSNRLTAKSGGLQLQAAWHAANGACRVRRGEGLRRSRGRIETARDQDRFALDGERLGGLDLWTGCNGRYRQNERCDQPAGLATRAVPGTLVQILIAAAWEAEHRNSAIRQRIGRKVDLTGRMLPIGLCAKATNTSANAQSMRTANRQSFRVLRIHASSVPSDAFKYMSRVAEIYAAKRQPPSDGALSRSARHLRERSAKANRSKRDRWITSSVPSTSPVAVSAH